MLKRKGLTRGTITERRCAQQERLRAALVARNSFRRAVVLEMLAQEQQEEKQKLTEEQKQGEGKREERGGEVEVEMEQDTPGAGKEATTPSFPSSSSTTIAPPKRTPPPMPPRSTKTRSTDLNNLISEANPATNAATTAATAATVVRVATTTLATKNGWNSAATGGSTPKNFIIGRRK